MLNKWMFNHIIGYPLVMLSIIIETCTPKQKTDKMKQNIDKVVDDEWWNADECLGIQPSQVMVITRLWHRGWTVGRPDRQLI